MRRVPKTQRVVDLISLPTRLSRRPYLLCRACERQLNATQTHPRVAPFTTSAIRSVGLEDRMRSAIWGDKEVERQRQASDIEKEIEALSKEIAEVEAAEVEEIPDDGTYREASTWDELEWVGGQEWVHDRKDTGGRFTGFINVAPFVSESVAKDSIAKAVREVDILKSAGLPLSTASQPDIAATLERLSGPGAYANDTQTESILKGILSGDSAADVNGIPTAEISAVPDVDISDPAYKFAITKRVMQLTGVRIPDPALGRCKSSAQLVAILIEKPKPQKLAELLHQNEELLDLPNVKIAKRRITPIDKEKEVGRWKVIEKELMDRGLPVVGH